MSDLIDECGKDLANFGYETSKLDKYEMSALKLFVDNAGKSKSLGFDKGHYFILNAPLLSELLSEHKEILEAEIEYRLRFLLQENRIKKKAKVLFVGIGNADIVADSFGVRVVEKIFIEPFKKSNRLFKIVPNVFSNTGINAYDIVRVIVEAFDISLVFLFDALATTNIERLGCSVQFNDAGLTPGSAMNNFGLPINKTTLNVPCFSLGVPMMISTKDLGNCRKKIILTEKDSLEKVEFLSDVVSNVINNLF